MVVMIVRTPGEIFDVDALLGHIIEGRHFTEAPDVGFEQIE